MQAVKKITGKIAPINRCDVDTYQIIRASFFKRVVRTGFGEGLFASWRQNDPDFVLNKEEFAGASILVAGPNFGIGSSREHAVWALTDYGFRAVISSRFGDIFRSNATKTGLVPVEVDDEVADLLLKSAADEPGLTMTIDVEQRTLSVPEIGLEVGFPMDEFTQYRLLNGLDDIGLTMRHIADIQAFEQTRPDYMPAIRVGSDR
jgi:3-isopropylmalate/(R)-2-methylmalate dehydratase small subunit